MIQPDMEVDGSVDEVHAEEMQQETAKDIVRKRSVISDTMISTLQLRSVRRHGVKDGHTAHSTPY